MRMPEVRDVSETTHAFFVKLLDDYLRHLWEVSKACQSKLVVEREKGEGMAKQNQYQPGDLVLLRRPTGVPLPTKLIMKFMGPFEVMAQKKNDVECRHLCMKTLHALHVERLNAYFASRDDAEKAARIDYDQHFIEKILYYRGNPQICTTMEFMIRFADSEERWVTWSKDLFDSVPYEEFRRSRPELFPLIFTMKRQTARSRRLRLNRSQRSSLAISSTSICVSSEVPPCMTQLVCQSPRYQLCVQGQLHHLEESQP